MSVQKVSKKLTALDIKAMKGVTPIVSLTAYTTPMAKALDPLVDFLLVGDSLAMTVYGEDSTVGVDLDTMIRHGKAVAKTCKHACVVVDLPFGFYQKSPQQAFESASRLLRETGCDAVKLEGGVEMAESVNFLTERGVPVMGHIGLTPQSVNTLGGFKIQGKQDGALKRLLEDAKAIDQAGSFAIVVEGVLESVADEIQGLLTVPSIGIGASINCDGQILVTEDMIGLFEDFKPKFVKQYAQVMPTIRDAVQSYANEVRDRKFPSADYVFGSQKKKT